MRSNRSATLAALALSLLAGATAPHAAEVKTQRIGDVIYAEGGTETVKGIVLAEPDDIMGRRFSAGFYPQVKEDGRYSYHAFARAPTSSGLGYLSGFKDAHALRAAKDRTQLCVSLPATALGVKACDTEHGYTRIERRVPAATGHHLELTYDGRIGTTLRIGYHEQDGGGAVTHKDGTLEFDLSRSAIVTYKDVRIEVLSADGAQIQYRLLATGAAT